VRLAGVTALLSCVAACGRATVTAAPADPSPNTQYIATGAAATYGARCDGPALIAHRGEIGDGKNLPENTWQAELNAASAGATYLNADIRWTSDGIPVALHDATVNRTTSETRPKTPITDLTAQQYVALDARSYVSDTKSGRIVPSVHPDTLAQLMAKVVPTGKPIVLQMEADPYATSRAGATPQREFANLAHVIQSSGYAGRVTVAGWTLSDLRAFHAVAPNVALAYLLETIGTKNYPATQQILAAGAHILYVDYRGVTASKVESWNAAGLDVWAWTPANRPAWQQLSTDRVEAIATNWATDYLRWAPIPCSADSPE
jgi:glycerophosphoryl diester phosphodiesterase